MTEAEANAATAALLDEIRAAALAMVDLLQADITRAERRLTRVG